jgi:hypothetical protein
LREGALTDQAATTVANTMAVQVLPTDHGYPKSDVPIIYADGVVNISPSPQVVKFYLYRTDADTSGQTQQAKNQICGQVVMPTLVFAQTAIFFERSLKHLVSTNVIAQETIDSIRKLFADAEAQAAKA